MRLLVQRVSKAAVSAIRTPPREFANGAPVEASTESVSVVVGSTEGNAGLLVLVGLHYKLDAVETPEEEARFADKARALARKLCSLKFFPDASGAMWRRSLQDGADLRLLLVSQFTMYADYGKGGKLDFHRALKADQARVRFDFFVQCCRELLSAERVQNGSFGERMAIDADLDGPVTVMIEDPNDE